MSPSNPSPAGVPGRTPNGVPATQRRPKPKANPLVADRRQPRRPVKPAAGASSTPATAANPPQNGAVRPRVNGVPALATGPPPPREPEGQLQEYPLFTTRRALLEGQRHHIMKLFSKNTVDVRDQNQFVRPVQLHRRDPRFNNETEEIPLDDAKENPAEKEERERQDAIKEERKRIREENMAQIAPTGKTTKPPAFQKKTEQHFGKDDDPAQKKKRELRYEEALPWHLEDFGSDPKNKQIWIGQYEAALSECYVAFKPYDRADGSGMFTMIPLEKWYRFKEKPKFKTYTAEEREEIRKSKIKPARWEMREKMEQEREREVLAREGGVAGSKVLLRRGMKNELSRADQKPKKETFKREGLAGGDEDNIDFDLEEEFADDEENVLFEGDDQDVKEAEQKIRKEQLTANTFDNIDSKAVEEEEERNRRAAELQRALEKSTRKALMKRERNYEYETDSDSNPYAEKSESEDSDAERQKEEERKKEEEKLKADKPASGTSTKGTNTPSGRVSKHGAPSMQKTLSTSSLKRPNSPNASDLSGNESSRKKQKKNHLLPASSALSRPMSPDDSRQPSMNAAPTLKNPKKRPAGAASGSDTDSVAGGPKKIKFTKGASPNGTPSGSRAASPSTPVNATSQAGSPAAAGAPNAFGIDIKPSEIHAVLPPEGLTIKELLRKFGGRYKKEDHHRFVKLVRSVGVYDEASKRVFRKGQAPPKKPKAEGAAAAS